MFHVKLFKKTLACWGLSGQGVDTNRVIWSVPPWLDAAVARRFAMVFMVLAWIAVPQTHAAIYKGTGVEGKVSFNDQPCTAVQVAVTVKPAAPPGPSLPNFNNAPGSLSASDPDAAARAAAHERFRAAQTPQCVALGDRITSLIESGARGVGGVEVKATMDRYEQQCAAQTRVAMNAESARGEARQKQLVVDGECKEKRRVLAERRPRLASLSSEDKNAFAAVESEVARVCR